MHTPPQLPHNGLTLIFARPSRFDTQRLLTGKVATWFEQECIAPLHLDGCDMRTLDHAGPSTLLPSTRFVALLGAPIELGRPGYSTIYQRYRAIAAYAPQECDDHRNIENPDEDEEHTLTERETKDYYPTRRANYRFWTQWFMQKLMNPCPAVAQPSIQCYPALQRVIKILDNTANENLYLDIETSRMHRSISCVGFSTDSTWPTVYCIPYYLHGGGVAYRNLPEFHAALARAIVRNTVVAHNAAFDLSILRAFYKLPLPLGVYDTMVANHRIVPEAEKSLAHVIPQWTELPFHKDTSTEVFNDKQQHDMWRYNARDVHALKPIMDAQMSYAALRSGMTESIRQANESLLPYLHTSLTGMRVNRAEQIKATTRLRGLRDKYALIAQILSGDRTFNPGSTKQCAKFFHTKLGYSVIKRNETGAPALGKKQLYQLLQKTNNPLIKVILKYREAAKDLSMIDCELWSMP